MMNRQDQHHHLDHPRRTRSGSNDASITARKTAAAKTSSRSSPSLASASAHSKPTTATTTSSSSGSKNAGGNLGQRVAKIRLLILALVAVAYLAVMGGEQQAQSTRQETGATLKTTQHIDHGEVERQALEFVYQRRAAWQEKWGNQVGARHWELRGHGFLFARHNIVLMANVTTTQRPRQKGTVVAVKIWNVHDETKHGFDQCDKLTLWARVYGPEIVAGMPHVVNQTDTTPCYWQYTSPPLTAHGTYQVHVKLVLWNGRASIPIVVNKNRTSNDRRQYTSACPETTIGSRDMVQFVRNHPELSPQKQPQRLAFTSFHGFKFYDPVMSCCEVCRRTPGCRYWSTPPRFLPKVDRGRNGCELYFAAPPEDDGSKATDALPFFSHLIPNGIGFLDLGIASSSGQQHHREVFSNKISHNTELAVGAISKGETSAFLGCSWSFHFAMDFPCLSGDDDDHVWMADPSVPIPSQQDVELWASGTVITTNDFDGDDDDGIHVNGIVGGQAITSQFSPSARRLEHLDEKATISFHSPHQHQRQRQFSRKPTQQLPLCSADDEHAFLLQSRGNPGETASTGRWVQESIYRQLSSCPLPRQNIATFTKYYITRHYTSQDNDDPLCWHRDNLSTYRENCSEMNCFSLSKAARWESSPLHRQKTWLGTWQPYSCRYQMFRRRQIQQCIDSRKISAVKFSGSSLAKIFREYWGTVESMVKLYEPDKNNATDIPLEITVDSLQWPHLLWGKSYEHWQKLFEAFPDMGSKNHQSDNRRYEHYWMTPYFVVSEREPYVNAARAYGLMEMAERTLTPKGYKMLEAWEMGSSFVYDTAAQSDGLHMVGPPMKMLLAKLLHYLCSEHMEN